MSTLRDAMSHAALGWVKPELDETLRQVRSEVEAYVEEPSDTGRMRFCAGYLHQVQGTLRMVELYAPAMVAEEMELLANAVREDAVPDREEACATLMRGTVLLPDYLERLQNGHRDIPIVLLPLLNEIRAARGAEGINESVLFAFNPDAGDASPAELEHARGSLSGRNRELLDTVGGAVKEELMRIKDALDLHVRTGGNPVDLQVQVNELGAVSDTLGVMGLGVARGIVAQQRDALRDVVSGNRNIDDNLLLDIAGALLYVDASLDDQVAHLGANTAGEDDPASVETRRTVEVLAHEAIANFTAARESFVAFIETSWDHQRLTEVPRLLGEVAGALRMLDLPAPADYLQAVREYIKVELVERQRVPSGRQLDTLADAMASLEYYLEALRDRRPGREDILDITRSSLEALNYWPLPSASAAPVATAPAIETVAAPAWGLDPIAGPDAVEPVQDVPSAAIEADVPDSAWSVEPVAASPAIASLHDAAETAHVAAPATDWNVEPLVEALAPAEMQQETFEEAPVAGQDAAAQTAVAAPSGPPPLPPLAEAPAAARQEYPLVFGAAINAKPVPVAEPQVIAQAAAESLPYATQSTGFDPVAAEAPAQQDSTYTLAPIALEGHLDTEPSRAGDALHGSFDPVAAESDAAAVASDTYSFDSSLLELEMEPVAASIGATHAPAHVEMSLADGFFEADLEEPVTVAEASPNAGAWQLEEITASVQDDGALQLEQHSAGTAATDWQLQDIEPEFVASDDDARDADGSLPAGVTAEGDAVAAPDVTASAQDNVPEPVLEDAEAAAFLAELDAAAAAFDPFAQPAVEAVVPQEAAEAAVATTTVAAATVPALDGGFIDNGEDIDQDIRDVFIEEFDEELENLGKLLPAWRAAPANMERLRPVRRVFHTLKGSGRLVGARTLGEFSWKIESMLNRVLDGSRPASPAVLALVGQAYDVLPELNAALRGSGSIHSDLLAIQDVADRVAAGEEAFYVAGASEAAAPPVAAVPQTEVPVLPADVADVLDGTPASVDSVLREILEAEIGVHLGTVNAWLLQSATQPQAVSEDLLRAVHTMSGAFAMTDVPVITGITTPAESFVKRSLAAGIVPGVAGVAALAQMAAAVDVTITALRQPSPRIPAFPGLAERLQALVDGLPDAKWPPMALDDELPPVPADTVPETAEVTAPAKAELVAMEDLSAYFDKSMLEDTLGELPSFTAPVVPEATPAPLAEAPAARWGEPTPSAASAPSDAVAAALSIVAGLSARSADQAEVTAPVDAVEATAAEAAVEADDVGVAALQVEAGESEAIEVEAVEAEAVEAEAVEAEAVEAEAIEAEAIEVEAVEAEAVEAEAVEAEAIEAEAIEAEAIEGEAIEAEAVEAEAVEAEAIEAEAIEAEAIEAEAVEAEAGEAEAVEAEAVEAEAVEAEAVEAEDVEAEAVEAEAVEAETIEAETVQAEAVEAEAVEAEAVQAEAVEAEAVDADASQADTAGLHLGEAEAGQQAAAEAPVSVDADGSTVSKIELAPLTSPVFESVPAAVLEPSGSQFDAGHLDFNELDRELVDIFVEEGKDLLDHCDGLISELRAAPEDREVLAGLQRDLHTLKGGARMAGINAIGDLGHGIESLLEAVAANRTEITRSDLQLLERGFDRLHQLLIRTGEHRAVQMPADLIEAFEARTDGRAEAAPAPVEAAVSDSAPQVAVEQLDVQPQPLAESVPLSAPVIDEASSEDEAAPRGQEQVRVRADLLDSLVNHAGEVAIYRSRLEQQLGAFRGAMAELDRTNARLRDQLRRLDLETEAQIVARYRREHEQADQTFDPLELDRFSTLQQLSRALNESAADLGGLQSVLDDLSRNYDVLLQQQSRVSSELQDGLMRARMVPFDGLVPRLRRVVRQAAQDTGKQVQLKLEGTHGELDRNVLDRMVAPLEHMLRNSVAHGLEVPEARAAAGKPEEGEIALRLRREGSEIVLEVADDGAGLDRAAIRRRAEQRGLLAANEEIADTRLDQMIFASGFSTSEQVSQLAGRGVGMDVVRNEVRQLGGSVDILSERGHGATFTLRLPQTLAVTQAVFVRIGETTYAVPVASVSGIGRISRERFESGEGGYHYNGEDFSLYNLGALVGLAAAKAEGQSEIPLLLVRSGDLRAAVAIDQVLGNREIVVKPVGLQIASVPGIYGATITGEGNVVVILDVAPLVRRHLTQPQQPVEVAAASSQRHVPLVMVVDDSLTMRKVTGRVLERHNLDVVAARDGVEALELLEERVPDLMLLDIEMPRMDGYELATAMRADPRYKDVPIVMITSRSGDKHRQRAFEIGVQRYLGKPYQELDLMRNVYDLLGIARARD
ncbi:Hpt domain-containing protein [Stenotrophomonas sp. UBA7606]|uniref:hybrid sensor histidine kinase/response regulator n=1 Tax=Stenotrophomonas sp. UBA7606 TaxID=1947559 RepID=UPI0025F067A2|nr:Hpt domain-containing protein [Stenotrophomonas sp. UBA7606]